VQFYDKSKKVNYFSGILLRIMVVQPQKLWDLRLLKDLKRSYYVCPECHAMIPDIEKFLRHAGEHPLASEFVLRNIQNNNNSESQQLSVLKSESLVEVKDEHDSTLENLHPDDFDPDVLLRDSANLNDNVIAQATLECTSNNQTSSTDIEHQVTFRDVFSKNSDGIYISSHISSAAAVNAGKNDLPRQKASPKCKQMSANMEIFQSVAQAKSEKSRDSASITVNAGKNDHPRPKAGFQSAFSDSKDERDHDSLPDMDKAPKAKKAKHIRGHSPNLEAPRTNMDAESQQLSVIKSEPLEEVKDSALDNLDPDDFDPDVLLRDSANSNQASSRDTENISLLSPQRSNSTVPIKCQVIPNDPITSMVPIMPNFSFMSYPPPQVLKLRPPLPPTLVPPPLPPLATEFVLRNIQNNNSESQQVSMINSEPLEEVKDAHESTLDNLDPYFFDPDVLLLKDSACANSNVKAQTSSRYTEQISLLSPQMNNPTVPIKSQMIPNNPIMNAIMSYMSYPPPPVFQPPLPTTPLLPPLPRPRTWPKKYKIVRDYTFRHTIRKRGKKKKKLVKVN
jgi:hypothetical protein